MSTKKPTTPEKAGSQAEQDVHPQASVPEKRTKKTRSTKGKLISSMSPRLPREILDNPVFKPHLDKIMRGHPGIYALYRGGQLYYVGLTGNLRGRIESHREDRHARRWDNFILFGIRRARYLKDIETIVQRLVDPEGNRWKGNVPRNAQLNRILREVLRDHEKAIRSIKKALR